MKRRTIAATPQIFRGNETPINKEIFPNKIHYYSQNQLNQIQSKLSYSIQQNNQISKSQSQKAIGQMQNAVNPFFSAKFPEIQKVCHKQSQFQNSEQPYEFKKGLIKEDQSVDNSYTGQLSHSSNKITLYYPKYTKKYFTDQSTQESSNTRYKSHSRSNQDKQSNWYSTIKMRMLGSNPDSDKWRQKLRQFQLRKNYGQRVRDLNFPN